MKHLHKFRDSNEMNARVSKKVRKENEQAQLEITMKKLEIADKIASLLVRENDGEQFKAW